MEPSPDRQHAQQIDEERRAGLDQDHLQCADLNRRDRLDRQPGGRGLRRRGGDHIQACAAGQQQNGQGPEKRVWHETLLSRTGKTVCRLS